MIRTLAVMLGLACISQWGVVTAGQRFETAGQPPLLVELYTSQGCSSCPPADQRVGALLERTDLWTGVVPMAFHVDYWDYLGWRDRFAQQAFSERQRQLKRQDQLRAVYTPGWVVDGLEWRGFFRGQPLPSAQPRDGGRLVADRTGSRVRVRYQPAGEHDGQPAGNLDGAMMAHLAVLGFDYQTAVEDGENRGLMLQHQFVVLDKQTANGDRDWLFTLPAPVSATAAGQRRAMVLWVTREGQPQPLQVVAGWLQ